MRATENGTAEYGRCGIWGEGKRTKRLLRTKMLLMSAVYGYEGWMHRGTRAGCEDQLCMHARVQHAKWLREVCKQDGRMGIGMPFGGFVEPTALILTDDSVRFRIFTVKTAYN